MSRGRVATPTKGGKSGGAQKRLIVALVERGGEARVTRMGNVTAKDIGAFMAKNADLKSRLQMGGSRLYPTLGKDFASHETVNLAKEHARGDVNSNSVEGFFGVFKRGTVGVNQHCGEQQFQCYLDEFTFRYNSRSKLGIEDGVRAVRAAKAMEGKRLTYRRIAGEG